MIAATPKRRSLRAISGVHTNILVPRSGFRRTPLPQPQVPLVHSLTIAYESTSASTKVRVDDERWLHDLEKLNDDNIDDAIVDVLDRMDTLLEKGQLERCSIILKLANPEHLAIELSLALLSGTLPARNELFEARNSFCTRLESRLKREMPSDVDALLGSLRP